ncbi:hypothetical protein FZEAL_8263 [Fusarium zealandicum]|uniref:Uncharacterized protein n=1 Tax=Fusarium zealandicum TaxID=1053134 RepID=A0A8H4XH21_9HYPO|nr:hypothetical protein FZEAL_8263 [Fusarium zealandicum]
MAFWWYRFLEHRVYALHSSPPRKRENALEVIYVGLTAESLQHGSITLAAITPTTAGRFSMRGAVTHHTASEVLSMSVPNEPFLHVNAAAGLDGRKDRIANIPIMEALQSVAFIVAILIGAGSLLHKYASVATHRHHQLSLPHIFPVAPTFFVSVHPSEAAAGRSNPPLSSKPIQTIVAPKVRTLSLAPPPELGEFRFKLVLETVRDESANRQNLHKALAIVTRSDYERRVRGIVCEEGHPIPRVCAPAHASMNQRSVRELGHYVLKKLLHVSFRLERHLVFGQGTHRTS